MTRSSIKKLCALTVLGLSTAAPLMADEVPAAQGMAQVRMRARATVPDTVQNAGFEEFDPAIKLIGWSGVTHGDDRYRVVPDTGQAYAGKRSLKIENAGVTSWGGAIQSINAVRFAGREVEFSAWVKTRAVTAPGSHIALKSSAVGRELAYITSNIALVGDSDWQAVKLRVRVPKEATTLDLILMQDGDGKTWVDEIRLDALPEK